MIEIWDPSRINKSPAIFDSLKLRAINAAHISALSDEDFVRLAEPWIRKVVKSEINIPLLCQNLKPRCEILSDIPDRVAFIDAMPEEYDLELYKNKKFKTDAETSLTALKALEPKLEAVENWDKDGIYEACQTAAAELEVKNGWLLYPLGIALSGQRSTPGGGTDIAAIVGKEKTMQRVKAAIELLSK